MTNRPQQKYQALTAENHDFIRRVADYAADRLYKRNPDLSKLKNTLDREAVYQEFKSELRSLLTSPHEASTKEIGSILQVMRNIDRLLLLQMRPELIHNFKRMVEIMCGYIASDDKLFFACFHLNLFVNKDEIIYQRNVATINAVLPQHVQKQFLALAIKQINRDITRASQKESLDTMSYPQPPENPLERIIESVTQQWHAFWNPQSEAPENAENELPSPRQRL